MKDENYSKANNARSLWHPMASPKDNQSNPPAIIVGGSGARLFDINNHASAKSYALFRSGTQMV